MFNEIIITDKEQELFSKLIYDKAGIVLTKKKKGLISGRLQKVLREKSLTSFKQYYDLILNDKTGKEMMFFINKLSTNHTYFFREDNHFKLLTSKVLPQIVSNLAREKESVLRTWSAAASSGEEIYTLKMVYNNFLGNSKIRTPILGTDISTTVLETAVKGIYPINRVKDIPKSYLMKYFKKVDDNYEAGPKLKEDVLFKRLNLKMPKYPFKHKFDIIFCRNVMIYFDTPTKLDIVRKFAEVIKPGGYLFIGMSETIGQENDNFKYLMPSVYVRK